jgi:hypothetical protein
MEGTDKVRVCPNCQGLTFQIQALSDDECDKLILAAQHDLGREFQLHRRFDGTYTSTNSLCYKRGYVEDWFASLFFVAEVLRKNPLMLAGLLIMGTGLSTHIHASTALSMVCILGQGLLSVIVGCRVASAYGEQMGGRQPRTAMDDLRLVPKAILITWFYSALTTIGYVFFVVPGLIILIRFCMALPIYCVERNGVVSAFIKSFEMSKQRFWKTAAYQGLPALALGGFILLAGLVALAETSLAAAPAVAACPPLIWLICLCHSMYELLRLIVVFSFYPLQLNLYREFSPRLTRIQNKV